MTLASGATAAFSAAGGSGKGYAWSVATDNSGGSISTTGLYAAGATGGVTDTVQLVDSLGNTATASVTVVSKLAVDAGADAGTTAPSSGGCGCKTAGHASSTSGSGALFEVAATGQPAKSSSTTGSPTTKPASVT